MTTDEPFRPIDSQVRIGHVHLKVADLERALQFYCRVLGFELTQRYGTQAAFVSAGGYHHHIGLNTWVSPSGSATNEKAFKILQSQIHRGIVFKRDHVQKQFLREYDQSTHSKALFQ